MVKKQKDNIAEKKNERRKKKKQTDISFSTH
jgi:hypothetical protein